jgi:hypothetical protein
LTFLTDLVNIIRKVCEEEHRTRRSSRSPSSGRN